LYVPAQKRQLVAVSTLGNDFHGHDLGGAGLIVMVAKLCLKSTALTHDRIRFLELSLTHMKHSLRPRKLVRGSAIVSLSLAGLLGLYVLNIIWRVSVAEQVLFGRSCLIPLTLSPRIYDQPPTADSYGSGTYEVAIGGKTINVYKQLINGFRHTYGSALAAFEIGNSNADMLFRANEYVEAYLCKDGRTLKHFLDTKKDLSNNAVGRRIGQSARDLRLSGQDADVYMVKRVLEDIDQGAVLGHFLSPRVQSLPSLEEYGCPWLPKPASTTVGAS
jgi:hypothetical protein